MNEIHLLVAVVTYKTKLLAKRIGLCSTWLASLKFNDKIPVWIQKGTFNFPYSKVNMLFFNYEINFNCYLLLLFYIFVLVM